MMEAIVQEIDVGLLTSIFNIPEEMKNSRVEVTIRPIKNETRGTTAERIERFKKKYNHETFVEHLKRQVSEGQTFGFDVQKVIDGTETEEEQQARYRLEKQTWGNVIQDRMKRGEA
jgi:hypothetical protein